MELQRKISKQKGVELCADYIFAGLPSKEIVQNLTETYGVSRSAVEKWMKAARPIVQTRQEEAERIKARENEAAIVATASKLNLTRERILEEYARLAFFDIRKIFTVDGGLKPVNELDDDSAAAVAGIENFDVKEAESGMVLGTTKKIKISDKRAALDSICRVMGYNAPDKVAQTDPQGNSLPQQTQIIIMPPAITQGETVDFEIRESE